MDDEAGHDDLTRIADQLWEARRERRLLDVEQVVARRGSSWSMDDAYAVQDTLTQRRFARGERHVGWKLGYTSAAMREQMGVEQPNFGPLTDAMLVSDGTRIPSSVMQPRVEPEIAIRLGRDIETDPSFADVEAAVAEAYACLEVVDSVWVGYRFGIEHNTADGSSAAYVVLGDELPTRNLKDVAVVLSRNGETVANARGAAASGDPLAGVVWLAGQLAVTARRLRAGDIVITGGLTAAVPLDVGDSVAATFDGTTVVSCHR